MTSNVSVYVLRERLHETWDKREMLKKQEEDILRNAIQDLPFAEPMIRSSTSLHDQALNSIIENTQGHETLKSWRSRFLKR
jgi:hypothetical protein